jgi:hypothetical protein
MLRFLPFYFTCFVGEPNSEASAIFKLKSLCCEPSYFILVVLYTSVESVLGIRNYLFPLDSFGSGSDPDPNHNDYRFSNQRFVQNLAFLVLEAVLSGRKLLSHFLFTFVIPFYVGSVSKSGSGTGSGRHFGTGPAHAKVPHQ